MILAKNKFDGLLGSMQASSVVSISTPCRYVLLASDSLYWHCKVTFNFIPTNTSPHTIQVANELLTLHGHYMQQWKYRDQDTELTQFIQLYTSSIYMHTHTHVHTHTHTHIHTHTHTHTHTIHSLTEWPCSNRMHGRKNDLLCKINTKRNSQFTVYNVMWLSKINVNKHMHAWIMCTL